MNRERRKDIGLARDRIFNNNCYGKLKFTIRKKFLNNNC